MIIAIANHKGGVGKTTAAVNLSAALAERKRRVLIVDLDTQGNVSLALGAVVGEGEPDVGEVLLRRRKKHSLPAEPCAWLAFSQPPIATCYLPTCPLSSTESPMKTRILSLLLLLLLRAEARRC